MSGFTCPALLWIRRRFDAFRVRDCYLLRSVFPNLFCYASMLYRRPQPRRQACGLGSSPFARRYLGNRGFFLFLRVLRCFSSPGFLLLCYLIHIGMTAHYCSRVAPFGHPRIEAHLQLPAAYRSLSRPSSAPSAKAFTLCSSSLDLQVSTTSEFAGGFLVKDSSLKNLNWFSRYQIALPSQNQDLRLSVAVLYLSISSFNLISFALFSFQGTDPSKPEF